MRPITVSIPAGSPTNTQSNMVRLDEWADAPVGVQLSGVSGTVQVQHSFDDPNDLINPVPVGSMFWDTGLCTAASYTANTTFSIATAPLWMRLNVSAGPGGGKLVITQYNVVEG